MDRKQYTEANRKAWNEVNAKHQKSKVEQGKLEKFKQKGYSKLDKTITQTLNAVGIVGKDVAQVCCNDGEETISLKNMGANSVTGFDIADEAIKSARELSQFSGVDCEFVQTDIYDIPEQFFSSFDLVYISVGSLMWFPSMDDFFQVVARLLRKDGIVIIYEVHPFSLMLDNEDKQNPFELKLSYFIDEPRIYNDGLDYIENEKYQGAPIYNFDPTLSQIINGMIKNGFKIEKLDEYPHDMSALFEHLNNKEIRIPLSMSIVAKKNWNV
ncbi:SAM-dependent methyltransferase [Salirhabdus euzebyi]|uniref:SAM-dependent methyltransferase n=1 Tax=Salirhabdus euzebyi TaxID=394506 RepID=A0A841Q276_9BACI|nr:class I SAM-dependent methyltransferase [Salirhabdus euzebyi]MBB6452255.1 SAM-dependent methyltransferase [Salirhabdus euzebyi]